MATWESLVAFAKTLPEVEESTWFNTTPHYDGYGAILVDLTAADHGQLHELATEAWRIKAPTKLRKAWEAGL